MVASEAVKERSGRDGYICFPRQNYLRAWSLIMVMGLKTKFKLMPIKQHGKTSKSLLPV